MKEALNRRVGKPSLCIFRRTDTEDWDNLNHWANREKNNCFIIVALCFLQICQRKTLFTAKFSQKGNHRQAEQFLTHLQVQQWTRDGDFAQIKEIPN